MPTASTTLARQEGSAKFYAVKAGHRPGVYSSWNKCLEQVKGFKGAIFKSFPTLLDAERFTRGEAPITVNDLKPSKFYAIRRGKAPGVYTDWTSAQKQISGFKRPLHKSFSTHAEAQAFVNAEVRQNSLVHEDDPQKSEVATENEPQAKRVKTNHVTHSSPCGDSSVAKQSSGLATKSSPQAVDATSAIELAGSDDPVLASPNGSPIAASTRSGPLRIYTDGSSLGNGQRSAFAGVGVYFGPADSRNASEPMKGARQTNQRAELTAVSRALEIAPGETDVQIVTDSKYSIDCLTDWYRAWIRNGWKTKQGRTVENRDLVERILQQMEDRRGHGSSTTFEWIKGHANCPGNVAADSLAVSAARKAAHDSR